MEFLDGVGDGVFRWSWYRRCPVDPDNRCVSLLLLVLVFLTFAQAYGERGQVWAYWR